MVQIFKLRHRGVLRMFGAQWFQGTFYFITLKLVLAKLNFNWISIHRLKINELRTLLLSSRCIHLSFVYCCTERHLNG